jgi:hypothetical protein
MHVHNPLAAAAQMPPLRSHNGHSSSSPENRGHLRSPPSLDPYVPICCELCLDRFNFHSHDAAWFPLLHDENIRDREVKERVIQYRIQNKIKQHPLPDGLKVPHKPPMSARLPMANAVHDIYNIHEDLTLAVTDQDIPIDPGTDKYDLPHSHFEDPTEIDTSQFDYSSPPTINSATGLQRPAATDGACPFGYRSLQE